MKACYAAVAALVFLWIAIPTGLDRCAIAPPAAVFVTKQGAAELRDEFLKGRIGVLQRSYADQFKIGAFRILSGKPLTAEEADSLYPDPPSQPYDPRDFPEDAWLAARQDVPGLPRLEDAFATASQTLGALASAWGFDSQKMRNGPAHRTEYSPTARPASRPSRSPHPMKWIRGWPRIADTRSLPPGSTPETCARHRSYFATLPPRRIRPGGTSLLILRPERSCERDL